MKSKLFLTVTALEIIIISGLVVTLHEKRKAAVLGVSVSALHTDSLDFNKAGGLQYFYEPKANTNDNNGQPSWLPYKPSYAINSDSLRDTVDHPITKDPGAYRIITLGDSFTYGLYVNNEESWPQVLESMLNTKLQCPKIKNFEVINLGMGGYDISYSAERFKLRGLKYDPDLVLWLLKMDDFEDINEYVLPKINAFLETNKNLTDQDRWTKWGEIHKDFKNEYGIQNILDYQERTLKSLNENYHNTTLLYSLKNLLYRGDMDIEGTINKYLADSPNSLFHIGDTDYAQLRKIDALYPDGHPNKKGDQMIAQDMYTYITETKMLPCN